MDKLKTFNDVKLGDTIYLVNEQRADLKESEVIYLSKRDALIYINGYSAKGTDKNSKSKSYSYYVLYVNIVDIRDIKLEYLEKQISAKKQLLKKLKMK